MDVFVEQIVKKTDSAADKAKRVLIFLGTIALLAVIGFVSMAVLTAPGIGILLAAGLFWGSYTLISNLSCEYEYIVTNGEIDVDKIIAQKKRVRLITAKAPSFVAFGEYTNDVPAAAENVTTVSAVGINESGAETKTYYADFKHASAGDVRLIFTPEQKVIDAIVPFLPRQLKARFH